MRKVIYGAAVLGAAASLLLGAASSSPAGVASTVPQIQHIVVLMQENHSFDSELGYWCDQTGRCDGMPASVTLADGTTLTPGTTPDTVPSVAHDIHSQQLALANEWDQINGCGAAAGYPCVGGYQPSAVPNLAALASTYAVEDHAFTLHDAPSWGGHLDELAATTGSFTGNNPYPSKSYTGSYGPGWGCDATGKLAQMLPVNGKWVAPQPPCIPDYALNPAQYPDGGAWEATRAVHVPTIMDEMDAAGVTWKIYAQPTATATKGAYIWSGCPTFADCLDTAQDSKLVASGQFFTDAAAGNLPQVSFLMPAGSGNAAYSQHNGQSNAAGDNWIGKVANAALTGPEASSTVLIVTYDDCGCFYDQVMPALAPDGRQMGPRVPFILAGPLVNPGYTDSTVTSSTGSILAFIEWVFGLPPLGPNDAGAYNLSGMFNLTGPPVRAPRMVWRQLPAWKYRALPSTLTDGT
jgi:phospholipase C